MVACVVCHEKDDPLRITQVSHCEHRVCQRFRRQGCAEAHARSCPVYCRAIGRTPQSAEPEPVAEGEQYALFDVAGVS